MVVLFLGSEVMAWYREFKTSLGEASRTWTLFKEQIRASVQETIDHAQHFKGVRKPERKKQSAAAPAANEHGRQDGRKQQGHDRNAGGDQTNNTSSMPALESTPATEPSTICVGSLATSPWITH
ncbi:hypothetical protein L915_21923 [Phytophthora nicotianae]|uniref:Retrotransposon gag domain-containing protein n=1 Tax=Phytophthora nicotianae TaxID=4792 RepID=W2HTD2_PHYNI|nr:hypothetical protein L915_21923 [Phytophthora nicotianae]ETL24467.1 hypothetical protein L916_21528 [Phytophthora nicotianae]